MPYKIRQNRCVRQRYKDREALSLDGNPLTIRFLENVLHKSGRVELCLLRHAIPI